MDDFWAHIKVDDTGKTIFQTCQDHCDGTARRAQKALSDIGLGNTALISGILHDCGKFTDDFQNYLKDATKGNGARRGSVNHTFAGVRCILEKYHNNSEDVLSMITSEVIAYAIGAHHGLFDCISEEHKSGFEHRLTKEGISYKEALNNFFRCYISEESLDYTFLQAADEMNNSLALIQGIISGHIQEGKNDAENIECELFFYIGMLTRLVLSAVVEGDRDDTATFFSGIEHSEYNATKALWDKLLSRVETKLSMFDQSTIISRIRMRLSDLCKEASYMAPGIYRLNMPTGSGKTLSSLRYSLAHAARWGKKRIVFVTPLLSILDQNATIIRDFIEDDEIILEHHSNIIRPKEGTDEYDRWEYHTQTWHSPIIITTMVQFLNTLFSGKMGCVRRMQALCESIIVIDEVQTVPVKMISMFNSAMGFLQSVCKATIIMSSATQPCFENVRYPLRNVKGDLVHFDDDIYEIFKRTNISQLDRCTLEEAVLTIQNILHACKSLLIVCNKKDEARYVYEQLRVNDVTAFHLSAAMCIRHRKDTLELIKSALADSNRSNRKVVCVSTQVIEAGVDISFEKAIRFTAGMDSIIQTAGRCNRSGEIKGRGDVYVLSCIDENLNRLEEMKRAKMSTENLLMEYSQNQDLFQGSLDSQKAIEYYYTNYYKSFLDDYQDYALRDGETIYNLMSVNTNYVGAHSERNRFYLRQAFATAGKEFKVFDSDSIDVLVPYGRGKGLIDDLNSEKAMWDISYMESVLDKAREYTVALYSYQIKKLNQMGALYEIHEGRVTILQPGFYNDYVGVKDEDQNNGYLEVSL